MYPCIGLYGMGLPMDNHKYKDNSIAIDGNQITGHKGWVTYLANLAAQHGSWYFEVQFCSQIKELQFVGNSDREIPPPSLRVGWTCRYQRYDTPLGINNFSIGYSSLNGNCHGDIVGCYIHIPDEVPPLPDPTTDRKLYEFIQAGILCDPQSPPPSDVIPGSYIKYTVNGVDQGVATDNLLNGCYHPAVSLFMGAIALLNLGM